MQTSDHDSVNVLVAAKISKPLAYKIGSLTPAPTEGDLVRVPLAGRTVTGIVASETAENPKPTLKLKSITEALPPEFSISNELLSLLNWCQRYYHTPIGLVVSAALPKSILNGKPAIAKGRGSWLCELSSDDIEKVSAAKQKAALHWLCEHGTSTTAELVSAGFGQHIIRALRKKALIKATTEALLKNPQQLLAETAQTLNREQQIAVEQICSTRESESNNRFYLLDGVTGSGKTEVYLQVAEKHLSDGNQVLLLVPEIGLIEQTIKRVKNRFSCTVLAYTSGTSESEKIRCWKSVRHSAPLVVVGTRSSIFLPFAALSLIVVDEEQDLSYKQQEGFRYNARDMAIVRATSSNATLILGSATPSIESLHNVSRNVLKPLQLSNRIGNRPLPEWHFSSPTNRSDAQPLSEQTLRSVKAELQLNNQVLVFINRRGFAPLLQCALCGWQAKCPACDTSMTVHRRPSCLICHRCDNRQAPPHKCPSCQSNKLQSLGLGTEQVESFLQGQFTSIPCIRVDRDSTTRKDSFSEKLSQLKEGAPAILVGTQMITKGHHLPGISLVVVLEAGSALLSHDYRAVEHMAQSLTQVAGRAGRGATAGKILIETSQSEHPVFQSLATDSYRTLSARLFENRKALLLPPFHFSALLHANSHDLSLLQQFMERCRQQLSYLAETSGIEIVGPMPSPTEKRNNRFRYQIQLYSSSRSKLHSAISHTEQMVEQMKGIGKIRMGIDIDPLTMD